MKKSIQDLKESLRKKEEKQQRLHEQEETVKKDIRVLRYLIAKEEEAASPQAPRKRKIPQKQINDFFTRIALFYEDLQRRLNLRITYRCFCRWLCTRYEFESRYHDRHKLSPCTILGYFKREKRRMKAVYIETKLKTLSSDLSRMKDAHRLLCHPTCRNHQRARRLSQSYCASSRIHRLAHSIHPDCFVSVCMFP